MKLHNLKQAIDKNIIDYLKRIENLTIKLLINNIEIDIITFKNIKNSNKLNKITFECNKNFNYNFIHVSKLIKKIYNEVKKINS